MITILKSKKYHGGNLLFFSKFPFSMKFFQVTKLSLQISSCSATEEILPLCSLNETAWILDSKL